jgi:homoserine dehydrogenase
MADIETQYYIRLNAADRPGVLAQVSKVFGDLSISISSAIQQEVDPRAQTAEIVLMTYEAPEKAMQQALVEIGKLEAVKEISNFIRVENI